MNLISKPEIFADDYEGDGRRFYTDGRHVHEFLQEMVRESGIEGMQDGAGWNAMFWCNHDQPRAVSRFGDDGQLRQEQDSIFSFYQQLIRLRHERPLIAEGSIAFLERENTDVIAYQRELDGEKLVVFCNFRSHEVSLQEKSLQEYTEAGFSKLLGNYEGLEKNLRPFEVAALIR